MENINDSFQLRIQLIKLSLHIGATTALLGAAVETGSAAVKTSGTFRTTLLTKTFAAQHWALSGRTERYFTVLTTVTTDGLKHGSIPASATSASTAKTTAATVSASISASISTPTIIISHELLLSLANFGQDHFIFIEFVPKLYVYYTLRWPSDLKNDIYRPKPPMFAGCNKIDLWVL